MLSPLVGFGGTCSGAYLSARLFAGGHPCCCDVDSSSGPGGGGGGGAGGGGGGSSLYPTTPVTSSIGFGIACPACIPGTVADELQVVVEGVAQDPDSIFICDEDAWNQTFILASETSCCYAGEFDKPGLYPQVDLLVCVDEDEVGRFVYFQFYDFRCTMEVPRIIRWRKYLNSDPDEPVDCGFDGLVLTYADLGATGK